ncbi:ATP-dependent nuclease [Segatella copri]|uniref:AAA family ATPase n=1 Tax=Segatella copri TaxID=165179 RepID=A0AAW5U3D5_9BACT|nr:AAA family ATPase [Segatella copri]MCW4078471.1 AAA family ATPase [Segatella copri]MCW4094696.1 AAA family ATPase [Segatella copri]MCW4109896.1 AAA family ATPase [Segatella copri]
MKLSKLYIKGFRNFKEATINFNNQSLIIGANDVGKTNLLYALRILLDRGFSDLDLELKESDFYAYEETNEVIITAFFDDIKEDCILSKMKGDISGDGNLVIKYLATKGEDYKFFCGKSDADEDLHEYAIPYYRKVLNIKYINSKRDFWGYINKTKNILLQQAKEDRSAETIDMDDALYKQISDKLKEVDSQIPELSYVKNATEQINEELNKLAIHNQEQKVVFDTASTDTDSVINKISITSKHGDKKLLIGGEGRLNQIYLSLWASQNRISEYSNEVSILCVEEPEAYLHPHQQRELARYLCQVLKGQVILTSHSPYIVCEFSPNSIMRLYKDDQETKVASDGCSSVIEEGFDGFGYRMSVIPAEAFFADCVILVEGQSELIFYKTLAKQIGIDLDRLNISILSVEGVGFNTYAKILGALGIYWVARTDNDIFKIQHQDAYRFAGIERGLDLAKQSCDLEETDEKVIDAYSCKIHGFVDKNSIPSKVLEAADKLRDVLANYDIFIADVDFETDLCNGPLKDALKEYYGDLLSDSSLIKKMKSHKAINIYDFLKNHKERLEALADDYVAKPLLSAKNYIEDKYGTY